MISETSDVHLICLWFSFLASQRVLEQLKLDLIKFLKLTLIAEYFKTNLHFWNITQLLFFLNLSTKFILVVWNLSPISFLEITCVDWISFYAFEEAFTCGILWCIRLLTVRFISLLMHWYNNFIFITIYVHGWIKKKVAIISRYTLMYTVYFRGFF